MTEGYRTPLVALQAYADSASRAADATDYGFARFQAQIAIAERLERLVEVVTEGQSRLAIAVGDIGPSVGGHTPIDCLKHRCSYFIFYLAYWKPETPMLPHEAYHAKEAALELVNEELRGWNKANPGKDPEEDGLGRVLIRKSQRLENEVLA